MKRTIKAPQQQRASAHQHKHLALRCALAALLVALMAAISPLQVSAEITSTFYVKYDGIAAQSPKLYGDAKAICESYSMTLPVIDSLEKNNQLIAFIKSSESNIKYQPSAYAFISAVVGDGCTSSSTCYVYRIEQDGRNTTIAQRLPSSTTFNSVNEYVNFSSSVLNPTLPYFGIINDGTWMSMESLTGVPYVICETIPPPPAMEEKTRSGVVAGAVVGSVVGFLLIVALVVLVICCCSRRKNDGKDAPFSPSSPMSKKDLKRFHKLYAKGSKLNTEGLIHASDAAETPEEKLACILKLFDETRTIANPLFDEVMKSALERDENARTALVNAMNENPLAETLARLLLKYPVSNEDESKVLDGMEGYRTHRDLTRMLTVFEVEFNSVADKVIREVSFDIRSE